MSFDEIFDLTLECIFIFYNITKQNAQPMLVRSLMGSLADDADAHLLRCGLERPVIIRTEIIWSDFV